MTGLPGFRPDDERTLPEAADGKLAAGHLQGQRADKKTRKMGLQQDHRDLRSEGLGSAVSPSPS